jgi:DNA-binding Xre family transcriptional regulator
MKMTDGFKLQKILIERGLSFVDLAEKLGITKQHAAQMSRTERFHPKTRHMICKVFCLPAEFFLGEGENG